MKKIKIQDKEYSCPTKWDEITLKQQIKVSQDTQKIEHDSLKKIAILSGYADIDLNVLKKLPISELKELFESIAFINTPIPSTPIIEFDFNGSHYLIGQNMNDMEFQDFISIENVLQEYSGNTFNALPTIIAIMSKRRKPNGQFESLDDYDVMQRSKEFEDLPISIANGISVFFYTSVRASSMATQLYSNPNLLVEMKVIETESMLKQLVGRGWLMKCVYGILRICLKYIKRKQRRLFTSTVVK